MNYISSDSIQDFLNEAGRIPLLTSQEEIILGRKVQEMQRLLEERPNGPYDDADQRVLRLGKRAKNRMITANQLLVVSLARKYARIARHMELSDLIQEGMLGLIRGVEKYDPERGYKFSTYGYWWIRQSINRAISQQDRAIKLPVNGVDCIVKLRGWAPKFRQEHGRLPTAAECAAFCKVSVPTMEQYLWHLESATSLDCTVGNNDDASLVDLIPGKEESPMDTLATQHGLEHLDKWLYQLPDRQREVIEMRYGLNGEPPKTLGEVGAKMKFSREAARQQEERGINKLKLLARAA